MVLQKSVRYNPFKIVREFESYLQLYTGAPYAVCVNSCTNALFLCMYYMRYVCPRLNDYYDAMEVDLKHYWVEIPKKTYVSVPMQAKIAGFDIRFREEEWRGSYPIRPFPIWDSARRFRRHMFLDGEYGYKYECVSFHWTKPLGVQQGGAILHTDPMFDAWARRARFDGRVEGVSPKEDTFKTIGFHMYMSPEIAAEGLVRLFHLSDDNPDLPNDDYPDLSKIELFK
jgi:hypothetical protein